MNVAIALKGIVTLLWAVVIGLIVLAVLRATRGQKVRATSSAILVLAVVAVLLTSVSAGLVFIPPEERGVVVSAVAPNGIRDQPLAPGLRWIIPFLENVVTYPIYRQTYTMSQSVNEGEIKGDDSISARTADGQEVFIDASVIYSVDPAQVVKLHVDWQKRYADGLVRPVSRGVIRDAISQYRVEEVYSSKRGELTQEITTVMRQQLGANGLVMAAFVLRNITFSPEYAASIEQKQIAEQQAEQARFVVDQRKQEAEQARQVAQGQADSVVINAKGQADARVIQAQAEAEALKQIAAALATNPDLLQYNYINKLSPGIQVMLVPNNSPYLLPMPTLGPPTAAESSATTTSPTPAAPVIPTPEIPTPAPTPAP